MDRDLFEYCTPSSSTYEEDYAQASIQPQPAQAHWIEPPSTVEGRVEPPENLVLGDNNYASGVNLITVPARQASFRHEMGYIFDDVGSDSDSVFKTSTIFAPEGTDDEKASKAS